MKIFFLEDFLNNKAGDLVNVSNGFARNFLIPNFLGCICKNKINIDYFKNLIILNDVKKKKIFKAIKYNFNDKNIYLKNLDFIFNNFFFYKNFLLKKIGFVNYFYYIVFFKKVDNKYILNIKLYNNIFIRVFLLFI